MKADIHPNYVQINATCSCGNVILLALPSVKTSVLMYVPSATRSIPANKKCLMLVVVLIALSSVLAVSAQQNNEYLNDQFQIGRCNAEKSVLYGRFFFAAIL